MYLNWDYKFFFFTFIFIFYVPAFSKTKIWQEFGEATEFSFLWDEFDLCKAKGQLILNKWKQEKLVFDSSRNAFGHSCNSGR